MRRLIWLLLLVGMVACGGGPDEQAAPLEPPVLNYHLESNPAALDPALALDPAALDVSAQLFEGLTRYNPADQSVTPALALDWDASQDGLVYTFKLREDALWVDQAGDPQREVTAEDVVYTVRRLCRADTQSPATPVLFVISGCREAYESASVPNLEGIGVRALAPFVVEFTLDEAAAYFPLLMSLPVARLVPQEAIEAHGPAWTEPANLLSHGPYRLTLWQRDDRLTLEKNERYYEANRVQIVRIDAYVLDPATALDRYRVDQLDVVTIPQAEVARVRDMAEWGDQWRVVADPCTYAYGFTLVKAPLDTARVRRALSFAVERERLVTETLKGGALPARHFAPPSVFGAASDTPGVASDPAQAQRLLAEAGYPGGEGFPPLALTYPDDPTQATVAAAVAEGWETTLGITVTLRAVPPEDYLAAIQPTLPVEEMPHVWALGWCGPYPDQHAWLDDVFNVTQGFDDLPLAPSAYESRITVEGGHNYVRRTANTFDELVVEALTTHDADERRALYAEAEQSLLLDDAVVAPLFHYATTRLVKPWLDAPLAPLGGQRFAAWSLDAAAREARDDAAGTR